MTEQFSPFELLQIATRIERNTEAFYRKAARRSDIQPVKDKLIQLADWQREEKQFLTEMKSSLLDEHEQRGIGQFVCSPKAEKVRELGRSVITPEHLEESDPIDSVTRVLEIALSIEREALCFYWGYKKKLWGKASEILETLIETKNKNVHILQQCLERRKERQTDQQPEPADRIVLEEVDEFEQL
jgi:rubrerythrin